MTNPIEMAMYDISQFFLYPVLLAIAALFVHAFYALGAFAWQAWQRTPPISGVLLQPVTAPDAPDNPPWRHLALGLGLATITAGGAWRQRRKAML